MANRQFRSQFMYGFEGMPVKLYAKVAFGADGAPTLSRAQGFTSVTRNSAGQYTFLLQDKYRGLLGMSICQYSATSAQAAPFCTLEAEAVASTKNFVLQYRAVDNSTATDPASGEALYLEITLANSSVG